VIAFDRVATLNAGRLLDAAVELLDGPSFFALFGECDVVREGEVIRADVPHISVFEDDLRYEHETKPSEPHLADFFRSPVQVADGEIRSFCFIDETIFFETHDELPLQGLQML